MRKALLEVELTSESNQNQKSFKKIIFRNYVELKGRTRKQRGLESRQNGYILEVVLHWKSCN